MDTSSIEPIPYERIVRRPEHKSFAEMICERMIYHLEGLARGGLFAQVAQQMPWVPAWVPQDSFLIAENSTAWASCGYSHSTAQYMLSGNSYEDGTTRWGLYTGTLVPCTLSRVLHAHDLSEEDMVTPLNEIDRIARALHGLPA